MSELLFAFETIAPMIGGIVLTGAFAFMSGLLLAQRRAHVVAFNSMESTVDSMVIESSFDLPIVEKSYLESKLAAIVLQSEDVGNSFLRLLIEDQPARTNAFGIILEPRDDQFSAVAHLGIDIPKHLPLQIPPEIISRLQLENPIRIIRDSDLSTLFELLCVKHQHEIVLTGIFADLKLVAIVVTSFSWPAGLKDGEQRFTANQLAYQLGLAWKQKRQTERQAEELQLTRQMLELRKIIDAPTDEPIEILTALSARLRTLVSADRAAIYFVARRAGERLQPIIQCGQELPVSQEAIWHRHEQALVQLAIESELGHRPDDRLLHALQQEPFIGAAITVPLRVNGRVLGAICLTRRNDDLSLESGRSLVEFSAEILSQTLRRVFDEATIRRQARHDHLTDLVNRRSFDAYLEAEIERVQHGESTACSLILADLDHFKLCNDRFGHQAGDQVLRDVAKVLAEQVSRLRMGENSIVARYGGEEFAILLPGINQAGACRIAESIRSAIESHSILMRAQSLKVTMSLGVAECPRHADSPETLILAADQALYHAKDEGRNRVCRAIEKTNFKAIPPRNDLDSGIRFFH